ncbi:hypothetical protein CMO92_04000 [Candidatus Woesearchaeota archaeon]|nr:hypothetical protein [Candidatus Woesearchaeota archaeon]
MGVGGEGLSQNCLRVVSEPSQNRLSPKTFLNKQHPLISTGTGLRRAVGVSMFVSARAVLSQFLSQKCLSNVSKKGKI